MLRHAFHRVQRTERPVAFLGIAKSGRWVLCDNPACDHSNLPSVVPWIDVIEEMANGQPPPERALELWLPAASQEEFENGIFYTVAVAVNWPPYTYMAPWWFDE